MSIYSDSEPQNTNEGLINYWLTFVLLGFSPFYLQRRLRGESTEDCERRAGNLTMLRQFWQRLTNRINQVKLTLQVKLYMPSMHTNFSLHLCFSSSHCQNIELLLFCILLLQQTFTVTPSRTTNLFPLFCLRILSGSGFPL